MTDNWAVDILRQSSRYYDLEELSPADFYSAIFSNSDAYMKYGHNLEVPVTYSTGGEDGKGTWRSEKLADLDSLVSLRNDAYMPACTYFPKRCKRPDGKIRWASSNSKDTVDQLCAFVLDIDRCSSIAFRNYVECFWPMGHCPCPTYLVASGNGVHLYYVLEWPVSVLKRWRMELEHIQRWLGSIYLRKDPELVRVEPYYSEEEDKVIEAQTIELDVELGDYDGHGLTQPYRVVGSLSKDEEDVVSAWRIGETWDVDELARMSGLDQAFNVDTFDIEKSVKSKQWAENRRRSEEYAATSKESKHGGKKGHNPVFYPWFSRMMMQHAPWPQYVGGRYNTIMCLVLAARKDNISPRQMEPITRTQIEADAREVFEVWNTAAKKNHDPRITWDEVLHAIDAGYHFNGSLVRIRKSWIADKCKWEIESRQKRNGRTQADHLKGARAVRSAYIQIGREGVATGGAPSKRNIVVGYASEHPEANHTQIAKALGVSRTTVVKWLRSDSQGDSQQ